VSTSKTFKGAEVQWKISNPSRTDLLIKLLLPLYIAALLKDDILYIAALLKDDILTTLKNK